MISVSVFSVFVFVSVYTSVSVSLSSQRSPKSKVEHKAENRRSQSALRLMAAVCQSSGEVDNAHTAVVAGADLVSVPQSVLADRATATADGVSYVDRN